MVLFNIMKILLPFLFIVFVSGFLAHADEIDSLSGDTIAVKQDSISQKISLKFSPIVLIGSSAIVPGLGQWLTGHYFKSVTFLSTEVILGLFASNRLYEYDNSKNNEQNWQVRRDSVGGAVSTILSTDTIGLRQNDSLYRYFDVRGELAALDAQRTRITLYHPLAWMTGMYLYNLMDAVQISEVMRDSRPRNPTVAGWLSAVPFLGLGQLYNGSYSKAGLVWMTQSCLAFQVYNYQMLMQRAEQQYEFLHTPERQKYGLDTRFDGDAQYTREIAFKNRNQYFWYFLIFYIYGILDAVVDAHLHDLPEKMRIEPDLVSSRDGTGISAFRLTLTVPIPDKFSFNER